LPHCTCCDKYVTQKNKIIYYVPACGHYLFIYYIFSAIKSNDFGFWGQCDSWLNDARGAEMNKLIDCWHIYALLTNNSVTFRYFQLLFSIAKSICAIGWNLSAPAAAIFEWIPGQFRRIFPLAGLLPGTAPVHSQRKCQAIPSSGHLAIRNSIWRR